MYLINRNILFKFLFIFLAAACMSLSLVSCSDDDTPDYPSDRIASRTMLVYMLSSDNGLGEGAPYDYDLQDIDEMLDAAQSGDLNGGRLVVFHSSSNGNQILKEITTNGVDTLKVYDTALRPQTIARMEQVIADMKSLSPADDYGLILWGHGSGWLQDGIADADDNGIQTLAYGSEHNSKYWMNITALASALEGKNFSFLYMDCCYMASVEVAYQLRKAVPLIVAYSTEVLGWGMPYNKTIKYFFKSDFDLTAAAQATFDFYNQQSNPRYRMCTVSVIDTQAIDRLAEISEEIYRQNKCGMPSQSQQPFMTSTTSYYHDFGRYVHTLSATEQQLAAFDAAMDDVVVFKCATERIWNSLDINFHSGLSTYILTGNDAARKFNYRQLAWFGDVASSLLQNDN